MLCRKTSDVSVEGNAGFFNVRGGKLDLKSLGKQLHRQSNKNGEVGNANGVSAEGTETVQHQANAKQVGMAEQPENAVVANTSSTQDMIGQPQPEKGTGLPMVPSLAGLLTFGAMALVGWKKFF